ncbi:heavy metal translocating P-type ATPase [Psychromonas sp. MME1]|uniref:heavy metal translocating P-type ATPase n=1 Tax=Psychromonas sp. MME1 TaxID=3231032 RepID=UPI0034E29C46
MLQTLCKINHMFFDKTGTLTQGDFSLLKCITYGSYSEAECINLAAQLEQYSEHPIAQAFHQQQQAHLNLSAVKNMPSQGLQAQYQGHVVKLGNALFCQVETPLKSGEQVIYLTQGSQLLAAFELGDKLRESATEISDYCHNEKIETTLLTGDISLKSEEVAELLHINHVIKGVTPQGKLHHLQQAQKKDKVLMVGDGINDAPVLAAAHISVALATGTDIAKNSADVILLGEDLQKIITLRQLAQKTRTIIKQNLAWALGYNLLIMPLAILGYVPPYIAVIGMSFSSLIVVSNSLRLLK